MVQDLAQHLVRTLLLVSLHPIPSTVPSTANLINASIDLVHHPRHHQLCCFIQYLRRVQNAEVFP